jgi:hypothetical protein
MSKSFSLTHKYESHAWDNFTYNLDLKLRELYHEHGTFIGTDTKVIINEPTGDVIKFDRLSYIIINLFNIKRFK